MDPFNGLPDLATYLRDKLEPDPTSRKKFVLLFAYNGTGKTRLSTAFKDLGKPTVSDYLTTEDGNQLTTEDGDPIVTEEIVQGDTLYFNAFTEDLFTWYNDLQADQDRVLQLNSESKFFDGMRELEMENRIGPLLERYTDLSFFIQYEARPVEDKDNDRNGPVAPYVIFFRQRDASGNPIPIKPSRGEENAFVWCFFLTIVQLVLDGAKAYDWVKYIYVDDPVSSLDEHNCIIVANHLVQVYREADAIGVGTVISTHHQLFFNVLHYELKNEFNRPPQFVLSRDRGTETYRLTEQRGDTPSFHHVAALVELDKVARGGTIHTYHFNMLRAVLEKTALFHGYTHFGNCIKRDDDDADGILHQRFVDLLSHGKYSLFEPAEMGEETRGYFRKIVHDFLDRYPFNSDLFPQEVIPEGDPTT
jgi:hypothetical protein